MTQTIKRPVPPRYFWLWHLAALKVIDADFGTVPPKVPPVSQSAVREVPAPKIRSTLWDSIGAAGPAAKVALIDTGVSRTHPNLSSRIDSSLSIDLTSHRYGAQTLPISGTVSPYTREQKHKFFAGLSLQGLHPLQLDPDETEFLEAMVEEYRDSEGVTRQVSNGEETFAAHGTACAGLLVGEPAVVKKGGTVQTSPDAVMTGAEINPNANLLPYFGVDPFSTLISVRTSFESDPYQFIAAFLYAWLKGADVIVLPRGLPDPRRGRLQPKNDLKADLETWQSRQAADLFHRMHALAPDATDPNAAQEGFKPDRPWKILKHLILAISRHIPVVCAAGNDAESQLIYPANLADDGNGIISVGAVTAEGLRSGYSNYGEGLTVVAPSDDYPVYNRHQQRLDQFDPLLKMHDYSVGAGASYAYCPLELVTTDLPGVFGYDSGSAPWSSVLPAQGNPGLGGGYYTAFGGTSGASCLIGGLVLLAQRSRRASGKSRLDGPAVKQMLVDSASHTVPVLPGYRPLTPDTMNSDEEDVADLRHFFGAGLPDAVDLVARAKAAP